MAVNPALDMAKPQGLSKTGAYEATVVDNNDKKNHPDKRMLGRIKIRVEGIFEGVKDEHLPWAIPEYSAHVDGASATSGSFGVPKVGTKVLVYFQEGSPLHPKYAPYTVDEKVALKEREHHYPNRIVHLLQNSSMVIVDTESNEVMIRNPGNANIYILGDVNLMVNGNVSEKIKGNKTVYIEKDYVEHIKGNKTIYLEGDHKETIKGDMTHFVQGDTTDKTAGEKKTYVGGSLSDNVSSSRSTLTGSDDTHAAGGHIVRSASRIDDNPGGGGGGPGGGPSAPDAPEIAKQPFWPVVRGKKPDTSQEKPTVTENE